MKPASVIPYLLILVTAPFFMACNSQTKTTSGKTDSSTIATSSVNALNLPLPDISASKTFSKITAK